MKKATRIAIARVYSQGELEGTTEIAGLHKGASLGLALFFHLFFISFLLLGASSRWRNVHAYTIVRLRGESEILEEKTL